MRIKVLSLLIMVTLLTFLTPSFSGPVVFDPITVDDGTTISFDWIKEFVESLAQRFKDGYDNSSMKDAVDAIVEVVEKVASWWEKTFGSSTNETETQT